MIAHRRLVFWQYARISLTNVGDKEALANDDGDDGHGAAGDAPSDTFQLAHDLRLLHVGVAQRDTCLLSALIV